MRLSLNAIYKHKNLLKFSLLCFPVFFCFKLPFIFLINKLNITITLSILTGVTASLLYSFRKFYFFHIAPSATNTLESNKGISGKEIFRVFIYSFLLSLFLYLARSTNLIDFDYFSQNYLYFMHMWIPLLLSVFDENTEYSGFKNVSLYMDDNTKNQNTISDKSSTKELNKPAETQQGGEIIKKIYSDDTESRAVERQIKKLKSRLENLKSKEDISVIVDKEGNMELDVPATTTTDKYIKLKNTVAVIDRAVNSQLEEHTRITESMRNNINEWEKITIVQTFRDMLSKRVNRHAELKKDFEDLLDKED